MSAGYSKTPLHKKLGFKPGYRVCTRNAPSHYGGLVGTHDDVAISARFRSNIDIYHFFTKQRHELAAHLPKILSEMPQDSMIWISWPKKASKVATDVTEDVVREIALPLGLVDVKVCAVDEVWSGLKLVIRKELRK